MHQIHICAFITDTVVNAAHILVICIQHRKIVRYCKKLGIQNISFYAFSTENWTRPLEEVTAIMNIFRDYLNDVQELLTENTKMVFLGDKDKFAPDLREKMIKLEEDTKDCTYACG